MSALLVLIHLEGNLNALHAQKGDGMKEKILDRIRKLLRIADPTRGASQQEQEFATAAAQRLLLEHNLHLDSVGDVDDDHNDDEIGQQAFSLKDQSVKHLGWKKHLLWRICTPLMVKAAYSSWSKQMQLVGTKTSCEVVKYIFGYVALTIERMAELHLRDLRDERRALMQDWTAGDSKSAHYSFCFAAASAVGTRLSEQYRKVSKTTASSSALVVQSEKALEEKFKEFFPRLRTTRVSGGGDWRSREAGAAAGQKIPLHMGVGQKGNGGQRQIT